MQINDLYQTKITCSTYNATIDSANTIVTVRLVDFNGNSVTNKSVTLTCDKGYFNKNGSTSISGTTTKSITATTNGSGEITATWTASEWGLCTFSANTSNIQVKVTGWKLINSYASSKVKLYTNDEMVHIDCFGDVEFGLVATINANYAPKTQMVVHAYSGTNIPNSLAINNAGEIYFNQINSNNTKKISTSFTYPRKTLIP